MLWVRLFRKVPPYLMLMCPGPLNDCHVVSAEGCMITGFIPCDGSRAVVDTFDVFHPGEFNSRDSIHKLSDIVFDITSVIIC